MNKKSADNPTEHDRRPGDEPATICLTGEVGGGFHYWRGASGKRHLHTVFTLFECPEIPRVNYILVLCGKDGGRRVCEIGQTVEEVDSLNLAHLRQRAALLGANEVHIHMLAETQAERDAVETDLRLRQLSSVEHGEQFARAG